MEEVGREGVVGTVFQAEGTVCAKAPFRRSLVGRKTGVKKMRGSLLHGEAGEAGGRSKYRLCGGLWAGPQTH